MVQCLQQCFTGFEGGHSMVSAGEAFHEGGANGRFVVGYEDRGVHVVSSASSGVGRSGNQSRALVPRPGSLVNVMSPPCASAILRQMANPNPVPCRFPVVKNG